MLVEAGDLVALASALGWAATTVMARHVARAIPTVWYNALRIAVAAVAMAAIAPWTLGGADLASLRAGPLLLLLCSVLTGFALGDTAFFESIRRLGVARAAPIAGCHPLVTAVLAVAILGEPVTPMLVVGVVVIGAGVWLITTEQAPGGTSSGPRGDLARGVVLALTAAVGWALASILVRLALLDVEPLLASTVRLPIGTVVLLALASRSARIDSRRLVLTRGTVGWLGLAGILTAASATLFLWSVELAGAARTAALSSASPIFSAAIAVLLLGERMTARLALGMGISLVGVLAIVLGR